ncbi:hypothetical protein Q9189_005234 [Teloschistes chrysophthalmus]
MATIVASKPSPPHQKMKRPPPPTVQTNVNGVKSSQSCSSPSLGSKRPPSASNHPQTASAATGPAVNGITTGPAAARLNNRRRDSQKPGDAQVRSNKTSKNTSGDNVLDRRKKMAEPYGKSPCVLEASYILRKFKNKPPSLIIHLHAGHFRFDQQDGSFSYKSPMKFILEHLKSQTVPHDMTEELNAAGVKFYEGCLIVQASSSSTANDKNVPFSIHNYNEHVTPSPFVPFPDAARPNKVKADPGNLGQEATQEASAAQKSSAKGPKIFTTVLLPTPQSVEEEVFVWANTPDPRASKGKQPNSGAANRTPASATMPHPPTPLSAVPSTPISGPPLKKQKMMLGESDIRIFESKITASMSGPLFLNPVNSLQEASKLMQCLTDSHHKGRLPPPKTRKRTVAELEADEAQAAAEEKFMLIMDERLGPSGSGAKAGAGDGEAGAAAFEPRFERFKHIEQLKIQAREKEQQDREQKAISQAHQQAANKIKQDQVEQHKLMQERKNAEMAARERQMQAYQTQNQKATLAAMQANQNLHGHGPTPNGMMPNQQHMPPNSQTQHSSPISRHMTPHSNPRSSPLVGSLPHSVPMNLTSSGQGVTSSPARPPSAAQHTHPAGGVPMVANRSQQRPPSRMGTPSMSGGTPRMQHGTPVIKQATPTPRMNHGSPPNGLGHGTPMLNANMAAQHLHGQQLSPEQLALINNHRAEQQFHIRQQQMAEQHRNMLVNGMSPSSAAAVTHGMSPMSHPMALHNQQLQNPNLQHLAAQNAAHQNAGHLRNQNIRTYQSQQQQYLQRAMAAHSQSPNPNQGNGLPTSTSPPNTNPNNRPMPPQPPHPNHLSQSQQLQPNGQQQPMTQQQHAALQQRHQLQQRYYTQACANYFKQLEEQYGSQQAIPPDKIAEAKQKAVNTTKQLLLGHWRSHQQAAMAAAQTGGQGGAGGVGAMMAMGMAGQGGAMGQGMSPQQAQQIRQRQFAAMAAAQAQQQQQQQQGGMMGMGGGMNGMNGMGMGGMQ